MSETDRYSVPGLERGLAILASFSRETPEFTPPELAQRLGIPRSTVFRLVHTLERLGFLERGRDGRSFRAGVAVLRLGFEYIASHGLVELGRPLIERLRDTTGHSAHIVVADGRWVVYIARAAAPNAVLGTVNVGTRLPAHATVLGRVLLCDMTLPQLRALFPEKKLPQVSRHTPETVTALHTMLLADRERGYGVSEGFFEAGISTIAAPVRDEDEKIVGAIGLTIPRAKIGSPAESRALTEQVIETAAALAGSLNYRGHAYAHALAIARRGAPHIEPVEAAR